MLGILVLAFGLRLTTAATHELRGDEAFSGAITDEPASSIIANLIATQDPHSPLHYFLLKAWRRLGGKSELSLRLPSIWLSIVLIAATARLGRDLGGRRVGLLAAGLMMISQSQVWIGHDARSQYLLCLVFALWATLLLWRREAWRLYAIAAALSVYGHYFGLFPLLAHGLFIMADPGRRRDIGRWVLAGSAAALTFLPWLITAYRFTVSSHLGSSQTVDLADHLTAFGVELTVGNAWDGAGRRWLFLLGLALALYGVRHWPRKRGGARILLLAWVASTALGLYLLRLNRSIYNDFYAVVAAPAWWLLIAGGLTALMRRSLSGRGRVLRHGILEPVLTGLLLGVLLLANGLTLGRYFGDTVTYGRDRGYRALSAHIKENLGAGDLILYHDPDPSLSYYLAELSLDQDLQPAAPGLSDSEINAALAAAVAPYSRVWFVPAAGSSRDPTNAVPRWLDYHMLHAAYQSYASLELTSYRPPTSAINVAFPLGATIAANIALDAVYLTHNGQPVTIDEPLILQPGDELAVTLFWQTSAALATDYVVFVHLLDSAGQLLSQHDGVPLVGTRPTSSWQVGERLLDRHVLIVGDAGPASDIRLVAGLYDPATLVRQANSTGATELSLFPAPMVFEPK